MSRIDTIFVELNSCGKLKLNNKGIKEDLIKIVIKDLQNIAQGINKFQIHLLNLKH